MFVLLITIYSVVQEDNDSLLRPFTMEELEAVVSKIPADKSPCPDGFSGVFYRTYWESLKWDLLAAIQEFYDTRKLSRSWETTFIALILKIDGPSNPSHYRPISLCNDSYKTISSEQGAFVEGRSISDNILAAPDVFHSIRYRRAGVKLMALKIDMERAYD